MSARAPLSLRMLMRSPRTPRSSIRRSSASVTLSSTAASARSGNDRRTSASRITLLSVMYTLGCTSTPRATPIVRSIRT